MNNSNDIVFQYKAENYNNYIAQYKSKIVLGNVTIMLTKKFNWFHRLMIKLVFGIKIKNIKRCK